MYDAVLIIIKNANNAKSEWTSVISISKILKTPSFKNPTTG